MDEVGRCCLAVDSTRLDSAGLYIQNSRRGADNDVVLPTSTSVSGVAYLHLADTHEQQAHLSSKSPNVSVPLGCP